MDSGLDDGFSKAFELALTPAVLGFLGWLVDQRLELTPLFTLVAFFLGVIGTSVSLWYRYDAAMRHQEQAAAEARAARPPRRRLTGPAPHADVPGEPGDGTLADEAAELEPAP